MRSIIEVISMRLKFQYNKNLKDIARSLRINQTNAELLLWSRLRGRQLTGYKFLRQFPISRYIIDFYCHEKKLAIEVDGGHHSTSKQTVYDTKRTTFLRKQGINLIRFWDNEVFNNLNGVLETILISLRE